MEDSRFFSIVNDPKFRRVPKNAQKVKIDKRFQSMFKDKQFKVKYTVDKRGRPVSHTSTEDLKRYYELSSEEDSSSDEADDKSGKFVKAPKEGVEQEDDEQKDDLIKKDKSDRVIPKSVKKKLRNLTVDYARGESKLLSESSSSDDEESEEEVEDGDDIDHKWGELDKEAGSTDEATYRLAACNMDWDRIRAIDLMVLFNSFLPPGGVVKSVTIYPSEFGKARMKEEELKGPIELVEQTEDVEDNEEDEEGSKYHMEKLRQYQLNRLKYYYAVVVFDGPASANKIYTECDGMEYESSATKIDLRFVPDDMVFDDEPKETCSTLPELTSYQPRFFTTKALQQAKVDLTWDETDIGRQELNQKLSEGKIDDLTKDDFQNYLASSSGEDSDEEEREEAEATKGNAIDKYRLLLQEITQKEEAKKNGDVEMEVSWSTELKDKTEELMKKRLEDGDKTPFQQYLDKRKEKRKEKRKQKEPEDADDVPSDVDLNDPYFAEEFDNPEFKKAPKKTKGRPKKGVESPDDPELELLLMDEEDGGKKHFNMKKIQDGEKVKKRKKKNKPADETKDEFEVNVGDDRFSALFTSHLYNIDPTDPHFRKTKGMETLIQEKIKRRTDEGEPVVKKVRTEKESKEKGNAELKVLVKSVKRKAEALSGKRKK